MNKIQTIYIIEIDKLDNLRTILITIKIIEITNNQKIKRVIKEIENNVKEDNQRDL